MIPTTTQTTDKVIDGLFAACVSIFGVTLDTALGEYAGTWNDGTDNRTVTVVEGVPGTYMPDMIVAVGTRVSQPVERPTMGTNRTREITVEVDVVFSVALGGNTTAATAARHSVAAAAAAFQLWFRTSPNETLGGGCRDSFVSNLQGSTITLALAQDGGVWGRVAEITATVTAMVRN